MTADPDVPGGHVVDQERVKKVTEFFSSLLVPFTGPAKWFRETIVDPNRQDYPWYHRRFR